MISSLSNFLMLVLYRGGHPERVSWTLLMFTLGAVGIARVAIEKDRAYSLGYAGILGIVAFVAMLKFVDSPIFSIFILLLIGFLSDRIVRDCTLIDDSIDASGQGLIDSGRLFVAKQMQPDSATSDASEQPGLVKPTRANQQNQPGRTVLYLALAALPLFGLGQFFLRGDDSWQRAQLLLALYLFSALSLLVTTSFLGLRRYLRQRKVDMPTDVSVAWLVGGLAMIAVILSIAYLAPMPGSALASFELPNLLDSPGDLTASRYGWGDDAADKSDPDAASTRNDPRQDGKEIQSITPEKGAPAGDAGDGQRQDGPSGKQKGGKKPAKGEGSQPSDSPSDSPADPSSQNQSGKNQSGKNQSGKNQSGQNQSGQSPPSGKESSGRDSQSSPDSESSPDSQSASKPSPSNPSQSKDSSTQPDAGERSQPESQSPESQSPESDRDSDPSADESRNASAEENPSQSSESSGRVADNDDRSEESDSGISDAISGAIPMLSGFVRLIVFVVLLAVVLWFLWANRVAIARWWQRLFDRRGGESGEDSFDEFLRSETEVPPRSFASYRNPFGVEPDARRIVVITFQAFEAWTREQGATRGRDETPSEFIRRVAQSLPQIYVPASQVVEAYNRIVYGRGNATDQDLTAAKKVWNTMAAA